MELRPYDGLHIIMMSKAEAERYTRNAYNVPDNVGLGWTPYTILIQSYGATAYKAFHSVKALRAWLGGSFGVKLGGWSHRGLRVGHIVAKTPEAKACEPVNLRQELHEAGLRYCLKHHDYIQPDKDSCNVASRA